MVYMRARCAHPLGGCIVIEEELAHAGIAAHEGKVLVDAAPAVLVEEALKKGEGELTSTGAFAVYTGKYTGRSPKDRFIADTLDVHDKIAWGTVNVPMSVEGYQHIKEKICSYLAKRDLYVIHAYAGANRAHSRKFEVVCELASQALFSKQLLVRPTDEELASYGMPDFTVLAAPGCKCDPAVDGTHSEACILINFQEHEILVLGSRYSGEIKKSVFSTMNYLTVEEDNILPMHSSVNKDPETGETAVFFGLSGTGKTTLSADPKRILVGDDEHAWGDDGVFNFEGGCYAKCIRISPETEPDIFNAIKFGSVCENVVLDNKRVADYDDAKYTENTRVAYPIENIPNSDPSGCGKVPSVVIFLTADAFGVLPPISRLDRNGAMYHFISGFTSKVAGTERGITEPQPTFSTLFGEPFMPLNPLTYAQMFGERMERYGTRVYLVNTGWTGGPYGTGKRMKLAYTRAMVTAALNGSIENAEFVHDKVFNVDVPQTIENVPSELLNPRDTWADPAAYDAAARKLASMFEENCAKKYPDMAPEIKAAGPCSTAE